MKKTIAIAAIRPLNIARYLAWRAPRGYRKVLIAKKEDLTARKLRKLNPRYVFLPHWSWVIPADVYEQFECVVFHMTDLPFGRGGSPLQNLIVRGIYQTKISALRVSGDIDAGPIYLKRSFDISKGSAEKLYSECAAKCFTMINEILRRHPEPKPQEGKATYFKRRSPSQSRLPENLAPRQVYDFIRMLDAPEYPRAFISCGSVRGELGNARFVNGEVRAEATFKKISKV